MASFAEETLTVRQVAEELGIAMTTVYLWINNGKLPAIRIGHPEGPIRIRRESLDSLKIPTTTTTPNQQAD